jgi:rod shape-determining protein MreC
MIDRRTLTLFVTLCLGQVLLVSAQVQAPGEVSLLQVAAFDAGARIQRAAGAVTGTITGFWSHYIDLRGAARENAELREQLLHLSVELQEQRALASQIRSLEEMLGLKAVVPIETIAARVMAGNVTPGTFTVTIDKGTADGVVADMAVLGVDGVVGRVVEPVAERAATVQLLVDANAAAAVVFERSRAAGIAVGGQSDGTLRADFVPVLADVRVGEQVTTSGLDGIYPAGFPVGRVESIVGAGSPSRSIRIRPATDFSYLSAVLLVRDRPRTDEAVAP